jgi:hypothetical protein
MQRSEGQTHRFLRCYFETGSPECGGLQAAGPRYLSGRLGNFLVSAASQAENAFLSVRCRRDGVKVARILFHLRKQTGVIVE